MDVSAITYLQCDTSQTPYQFTTAFSKSIQYQSPLVRRAASTAYEALALLAASSLGVPQSQLVSQYFSFYIRPVSKHPTKYSNLFAFHISL